MCVCVYVVIWLPCHMEAVCVWPGVVVEVCVVAEESVLYLCVSQLSFYSNIQV